MAFIYNPLFLSVLLGHLTVDILNGQRSVLFTFMSETLSLSNAELGLFSTAYIIVAAIMQPVFGYLTDRFGPRWVISGGILWMGGFYAGGLMLPGVTGMLLLVIASMGSGAFHPAGTMQAILAGRKLYQGRETTSASIFFLFGQIGHFIGPLLAGLILVKMGSKGLLWVVLLTLPVALFSADAFKKDHLVEVEESEASGQRNFARQSVWVLLAFALLVAFQSWSQQSIVTFMPKYLSDLGQNSAQYGLLTSLFMGGSAVGNLLGGNLADRYGKRRIVASSLALASIPIALISLTGWTPWFYLLIPLAGAFTGSTHSIIVVLAQRLIPSGMGLASGLILGFMFSSGALGALASGYIADAWGFEIMFRFTVVLVISASALALTLPKS